ncbi:uroporphyrinogen-III synthase [Roseovarius pelagicus]|uniref:Uroporphyrinogen-III synthase n=1 Tax=Roseovarius pelagicus TaxID=2980108 RepID=A0ABY6D9X8_9RHOB|nr:uroporphyrinogen-III synthase [Roseovarius pelagicus]UXX82689.1 uroporphyrinogen-III synthase [Roseovarius pelagicus]
MQTTPLTSAAPLVLITRPEPGASQFATAMSERYGGRMHALCSPVMDIVPAGAVPDLTGVRTLVFTSQNGVLAYAAGTDRRDIPCYAVGDTTAQAAERAGIQAISAKGTAEDLLAMMLSDDLRGPVLHLRGAHAAADVAGALRDAGYEAHDAVLYEQEPRGLTAAAREALRGKGPVILPLFSPRSARLVIADTYPTCPLVPLAISDAAALALPAQLAQAAIVAQRPDGCAMLEAMADALTAAKRLEGAIGPQ